jgi:hypothetical protein
MKAELYMVSPEQEFSLRTVQEAPGSEAAVPREQMIDDQWLRLWDRNWIRLWERNWLRLWERNWLRHWERGWFRNWERGWIRWEPPWEIDRIIKGEKPGEIEPIMERLLLRREKDGFLAMDSLTSRVLKLDEQAGKLVQLVQDGVSLEEAAKKLGAKKEELEEFLSFLDRQDISDKR